MKLRKSQPGRLVRQSSNRKVVRGRVISLRRRNGANTSGASANRTSRGPAKREALASTRKSTEKYLLGPVMEGRGALTRQASKRLQKDSNSNFSLDDINVEKKVLRSRNLNAIAAALAFSTAKPALTVQTSCRKRLKAQMSSRVLKPHATRATTGATKPVLSTTLIGASEGNQVSPSSSLARLRRKSDSTGNRSVLSETSDVIGPSNVESTKADDLIDGKLPGINNGSSVPTSVESDSMVLPELTAISPGNIDVSGDAGSVMPEFPSDPTATSVQISANILESFVEDDSSIDLSAYEEFDFLQEDEYCPNGIMSLEGSADFDPLKPKSPDFLTNLVQPTSLEDATQHLAGSSSGWISDGCGHGLQYSTTAVVESSYQSTSSSLTSSSFESSDVVTSSTMATMKSVPMNFNPVGATSSSSSPNNTSEYNQYMPSTASCSSYPGAYENNLVLNNLDIVPSTSPVSPGYSPHDFITQQHQPHEPESSSVFNQQNNISGECSTTSIVSPMYSYYRAI